MTGQEIRSEALLDQPRKTIKTFTHVCRFGTEEHAHGRGKLREHQSAPRAGSPSRPAARIATRSKAGSMRPVSRTTQALAKAISSCPLGPASSTDTGRKAGAGAPLATSGLAGSRSEMSGEVGALRKRRFQA